MRRRASNWVLWQKAPRSCARLTSSIPSKYAPSNAGSIQEIRSKHQRDGIMRRNKLLLEHILHERLHRTLS